jgi:hypothetical protein
MCFIHAFLIVLIKKNVFLTCLKDMCPFYMWVVRNLCSKFNLNYFHKKRSKIKYELLNFLLFFLNNNKKKSQLIFFRQIPKILPIRSIGRVPKVVEHVVKEERKYRGYL